MYKVIEAFIDGKSGNKYEVNDFYPHDGVKVTKARINLLASDKNELKRPFIEEIVTNDK